MPSVTLRQDWLERPADDLIEFKREHFDRMKPEVQVEYLASDPFVKLAASLEAAAEAAEEVVLAEEPADEEIVLAEEPADDEFIVLDDETP